MIKNKVSYFKVFFVSLIMMTVILIPEIIRGGGVFVYAGDYALQQIPFYTHAAFTVQNMSAGWDWFTDLGADFISSYSYYMLGSVFFWLISFLKGKAIIYAMPFMLAFKTAVASVTSFAYIKRYTENETTAFIGALMYAFSGFQMFNVVYNSFHDVTALFPLLLLSFDLLVTENRKVFFAVMVGVMALTNYYFFFGQVVFVLIYYIIRCVKKDFVFRTGNFFSIFIESVIGTAMAAVLLIPSYYAVSSGSRIGSVLGGTDLISYADNTIIPKIFQSMLIMPDSPSQAQLFQSLINENNWASVSLYLPLFTITGVITYIKKQKKHWLSLILMICLFMSCVPVLNSIFYMFNSSYYARWFYMPVLFMCIATVKTLDSRDDLKFALKVESVLLGVLGVIAFLPGRRNEVPENIADALKSEARSEGTVRFGAMSDIPVVFWQSFVFSAIFLLILYIYNEKRNCGSGVFKKLLLGLIGTVMITYPLYLNNSHSLINIGNYKEKVLDFSPTLSIDESFFRNSSINDSVVNYNMIWGYSSADAFHSIVPKEDEDFFELVKGKKRMMTSKYKETDYPVLSLLSVKYVFNESTGDDLNVEYKKANLSGFELYDKQGYYYIYENKNFIPMGFMYDYCISRDKLDEYLESCEFKNDDERNTYRQLIMLRAAVLDDEDVKKYSSVISEIPENMIDNLGEDTYQSDCTDRKNHSCYEFSYDSKGFEAKINLKNKGLVFFSVPNSSGWSAEVNGETSEIINVNGGLSAVIADSGDNEIKFSYESPGFSTGKKISLTAVICWGFYATIIFILNKNKKTPKNI